MTVLLERNVGRWIGKERERERAWQGEQLIHHKLRNKEKRGCVAGESTNSGILATKLYLFVKSCRGRNCLRYWHRTVPHTYDLLESSPPPDFYFLDPSLCIPVETMQWMRKYIVISNAPNNKVESSMSRCTILR